MKKITFIFLWIYFPLALFSQKKELDHHAYFLWKKVEKTKVSKDGNWVSYEINPLKGDGFIYWYQVDDGKLDSVFRGKDLQMTDDASLLVWKVTPGFDTLRLCELKKIDKKKWPKDSLFILNTSTKELDKIPELKGFQISSKGNVLVYVLDKNEILKTPPISEKKCKIFKTKDESTPPKEIKSDGTQMCIRFRDSLLYKTNYVTDYVPSSFGNYTAFTKHRKGKQDTFDLHIFNKENGEIDTLFKNGSSIKNLVWNNNESFFSFMYSNDTTKLKQYNVGIYDLRNKKLSIVGDSSTLKDFKYLGINDLSSQEFYDNIPYLKLVLSERIVNEKDTLLESEKVKIDIWHYQDLQIQPQQIVALKDVKKGGIRIGYNLENGTLIQWAEDSVELNKNNHELGNYALVYNENPYAIEAQWKSPSLQDIFRLDLRTGEQKLIQKRNQYGGQLSVSGEYFAYFDPISKQHILKNIENQSIQDVCMNCGNKEHFEQDANGQPMNSGPVSSYGFNKKSSKFYFASRENVYCFNISNNKLECISCAWNTNNEWEWSMIKWNYDSISVSLKNMYFKGIHKSTKKESIRVVNDMGESNIIAQGDFLTASIQKSVNGKTFLLRRMNVSKYPNVEVIVDSIQKKISNANPQQMEYNWATSELIRWKSYSGFDLEGIVYKPENFDPKKKYPLLVYFYELNGDNLHAHRAPAPSASTINPIEYASAGYLVFIPDIRYKAGYPAKGAYDCIMSGTDYVIKNYPVDSLRMGLQGQSWGGYQTAQLITMTSRYHAAMAGAPVSNMFSAYGGIRWGSGMNRQFQYESAQSRIGATIWEHPELYVENSPLFHLPKVQTPLLIMSNDKDGAVPWYQGIELYNGMRRLQKPCWLLNYNEDDHNLTKLPNKIDLSIRMKQFFDHYLMAAPMPLWMSEGIKAEEKGKKYKY